MRRHALLASILLSLSLLTPAPPTSALAADTRATSDRVELDEDLVVERLTEHVWRHVSYKELERWGRVPANGLVVVDDGEAAIVDTPWTDGQTELLIRWIEREVGARVVFAVPTHYHGDCMGGLAAAHRLGAESYALDMTADRARETGLPVPQSTFSARAEIQVGSLTLDLAFHGGAHSADNIVVWIPAEKILFGGCAVRSARSKTLGNTREAVLDAWPATIESLRATYPSDARVVPGHGAPGGAELLERTLELLREKNVNSGQ